MALSLAANFEFAGFQKQKLHGLWPYGPYGKIPTKKEPITTPCHIIKLVIQRRHEAISERIHLELTRVCRTINIRPQNRPVLVLIRGWSSFTQEQCQKLDMLFRSYKHRVDSVPEGSSMELANEKPLRSDFGPDPFATTLMWTQP